MLFVRICLAFAVAACISSSASATTIAIAPAKDTTVFQGSPNNSDGGGPGMFAGMDNTSTALRGLIHFDIGGAVPAGATITDVQLTLYLGQVAGGGVSGGDTTPRTIGLHRLNAEWGEGTNGSTFTTIGGTGAGFPANSGDATWNARHFDSVSPILWTTAGGDAAAAVSASTLVSQTLGAPYTWGTTSSLVSDVQGWLDNPSSNFGWLLKNENETGSRTFRAFWTREAVDSSLRPQLQVTYSVPEPGSVLLSAIFIAALLTRRKFAA